MPRCVDAGAVCAAERRIYRDIWQQWHNQDILRYPFPPLVARRVLVVKQYRTAAAAVRHTKAAYKKSAREQMLPRTFDIQP